MERRNFHFYTSVQYSWLVEAAAAEGDIDTARRYAAHVLGRAREGERLGEAMACRALAKLAARRGILDEAGAGCCGPKPPQAGAARYAMPL